MAALPSLAALQSVRLDLIPEVGVKGFGGGVRGCAVVTLTFASDGVEGSMGAAFVNVGEP